MARGQGTEAPESLMISVRCLLAFGVMWPSGGLMQHGSVPEAEETCARAYVQVTDRQELADCLWGIWVDARGLGWPVSNASHRRISEEILINSPIEQASQ